MKRPIHLKREDKLLYSVKCWIDYPEERVQEPVTVVERVFLYDGVEVGRKIVVCVSDYVDYELDRKLLEELKTTGSSKIVLSRRMDISLSIGEFTAAVYGSIPTLNGLGLDLVDNYYSVRLKI